MEVVAMAIRRTTIIRVFAATVTAMFLTACGGGDSAPELLTVAVHPVSGTNLDGPNQNPFDVNKAKRVRFSVTGAGISGLISSTVDFSTHQAALPEIPEGYGRQVTVEVCSDTCNEKVPGDIIARGRSVPLSVFKGDPERTMDIFVSPRNSFSPPVDTSSPPAETSPLQGNRIGSTATVLDDGRVLILGGATIKSGSNSWTTADGIDTVLPDAEVFDPRDGSFTSLGPMTIPRAFHQSVKISDGRVVILGGYTQIAGGEPKITDSIEAFDTGSGTFTQSSHGLSGGAGRALFTAGLAGTSPDVIFLAGGLASPAVAGSTWDMYIFDTGTVGHGTMATTRYNHTMTYLKTYGRTGTDPGTEAFVLFGGENDVGVVGEVEAFTVAGFEAKADDTAVTTLPGGGRTMPTSIHVPQQGIVYVIGGFTDTSHAKSSNRVDVFREGLRGFVENEVLFLDTARGAHTSTLIDYNTILVAGGLGAGGNAITSTELIIENLICDDMEKQEGCKYVITAASGWTPSLSPARAGHVAVFDDTRRVFIAGGFSQPSQPVTGATLYNPD